MILFPLGMPAPHGQHPVLMRWQRLIYPGLVILTLLVYAGTLQYGFVNYDDTTYVTENRHLLMGLTPESVAWAFTTDYFSNWHPLTWLSYLVDVELFGPQASGFHIHNVLLHAANVVLLFTLLWRMTGMPGRSAFVAALFASHPLHVESVAWISERKDVLSTFFGLLAVCGYLAYTRRRRSRWYLAALVLYACSLMSKQSLVTLPFVLLLLDYWPLRRFAREGAANVNDRSGAEYGAAGSGPSSSGSISDALGGAAAGQLTWSRLVVEKLPFAALAVAASVVVLIVQSRGGSVAALEHHPWPVRVSNAVVVYLLYIAKMLWPVNLSVFYPHPGRSISPAAVIAAALALVLVTAAVIVVRRRRPYLLVGWCWYLGTLVPMIGLIQVGQQRMADRYTYVPLIGLYVALTWLVADLARSFGRAQRGLAVAGVLVIAAAAGRAWHQAGFWRDSSTLFSRALEAVDNNHIAHNGLGYTLKSQGRIDEAIRHYQQAVRIAPWFVEARTNLGSALYSQGRIPEAIEQYRQSLETNPRDVETLNNLAIAVRDQGGLEQAVGLFRRALEIDSDQPAVHTNLGIALYRQQRIDDALFHLREAVRIDPDYATGHYNLAAALFDQKQFEQADRHRRQALRLQPGLAVPGTPEEPVERRRPATLER